MKAYKRWTPIILTLFLGCLGGFFYFKGQDEIATNTHLSLPHFKIKDINGNDFVFPDPSFKGLTFIHFWASWCEPCIDELPELFHFMDEASSLPVRLIAISLDTHWKDSQVVLDTIPAYKNQKNIVQLIDPDLKIAHDFGSFQFPETIVLKDSDRILTKWVGPQKWKDPYYKKSLDFFLNKTTEP